MTLQEIEHAILELSAVELRRLRVLIRARLRQETEEVPYKSVAQLAGIVDDAPTDLSSNKQYLEGLGRSSVT